MKTLKGKSRKEICKTRQGIALMCATVLIIIGFPMSLIGSGLDGDYFNSWLYFIGLILSIMGLSIIGFLDYINNN